jgi:hypothetical protein
VSGETLVRTKGDDDAAIRRYAQSIADALVAALA